METKTVKKIRFFTVIDWRDEQEYLTQQHREGWKFVKQTGNVYTFERCEPEEVVYQIDSRATTITEKSICKCSRTAGGSICRINTGTAIFVSLQRI